jgi:hypothetical protein
MYVRARHTPKPQPEGTASGRSAENRYQPDKPYTPMEERGLARWLIKRCRGQGAKDAAQEMADLFRKPLV